MTPHHEECCTRFKSRAREYMNAVLKVYYASHPDRLYDARGEEAVNISVKGLDELTEILAEILNDYELAPLDAKKQ